MSQKITKFLTDDEVFRFYDVDQGLCHHPTEECYGNGVDDECEGSCWYGEEKGDKGRSRRPHEKVSDLLDQCHFWGDSILNSFAKPVMDQCIFIYNT